MGTTLLLAALCLAAAPGVGNASSKATEEQAMRYAKLVPVPFTAVTFTDRFWAPRQEINRTRTLPHNINTCEKTGRLRNFAQAAGLDSSPYTGHYFHDSDVYKVIEGAAYCLATHPDPALDTRLDVIIDHIAKAQQPDGYLNTWFILKEPDRRWTDLPVKHELYCAGHLFEAAVAHYEATGKRKLLEVACRFADHIDGLFGPGKRHAVPGHEEIELALIKLWRATGEERYLRLAQFFVDERGQADTHKLYGPYCQDHQPIRQQTEAVGHCVRAMYLYSAVADLAALTGDQGYINALEALWQDVVRRKMYVTGGIGVQGHGEGFARPYFLPNYEAYCETCAAIGMVFWNQRLLWLHGEGRFADIVERELYNGMLSGVSLEGTRFFYVNPLASRGDHHRQTWYDCACCPTNVVRVFPVLGGYVYATSEDGKDLWVLQYAANRAQVQLGSEMVAVEQTTDYPWNGRVRIELQPKSEREFILYLRIPGWCEKASISVNGRGVEGLTPEDGFVRLRRKWTTGDVVELDMDMPVRRVQTDVAVEENRGRVALQRGPIVYCFEEADHEVPVSRIVIPDEAEMTPHFEPGLLGGVVVLRGRGMAEVVRQAEDGALTWETQPVPVMAVPYYAWDNRKPGEMVVWVPTQAAPSRDADQLTIAVMAKPSASHCWPADSLRALNDGVLPENSIDHSIPRFTWWDHRGTVEWVQYDFAQPMKLSKAEVYWFDDTGRGQCRVPKSWRLLWWDGNQWREVDAESSYGVDTDTFNAVSFKLVTTTALRLEVQLQDGFSGGLLEWRLPQQRSLGPKTPDAGSEGR